MQSNLISILFKRLFAVIIRWLVFEVRTTDAATGIAFESCNNVKTFKKYVVENKSAFKKYYLNYYFPSTAGACYTLYSIY